MENKIFIALSLVLFVLFISCNQKVKIEHYPTGYYPTGEVYKTEKRINERETEVRFYYRNGQIEQEGIIRDSLREGQWNDYYNDGVLRGELIFSKGQVINENIKYPIRLDFKGNTTEFKVGQPYLFRVLGVSAFYSIQTHIRLDYKRILIEDFNDAQYLDKITPQRVGNDTIWIIIKDYERNINNGSISFPINILNIDTIYFPIKVVN
jgi:antitoxin component YwqK of YwqJK toxin-antitoxin module